MKQYKKYEKEKLDSGFNYRIHLQLVFIIILFDLCYITVENFHWVESHLDFGSSSATYMTLGRSFNAFKLRHFYHQ